MAKKKELEKKEPTKTVFDDMPIDEWLGYIEKTAETEEEKRALKVLARRRLNVDNMVEYIEQHDNSKEAKRAFKNSGYYTVKKDGVIVVDEDNKIKERLSVMKLASYFVEKYIQELKVEKKQLPKKESVFDKIADW